MKSEYEKEVSDSGTHYGILKATFQLWWRPLGICSCLRVSVGQDDDVESAFGTRDSVSIFFLNDSFDISQHDFRLYIGGEK